MIVRQTNTGWQVIHQQAHGLLAVQIGQYWQAAGRPVHWIETLVALTEHDDGQDSWVDQNHLTSVGTPLPFQLIDYSIEQCQRLIGIGLEKSRWNALMLSMHISFLYESKRGTDPELDKFLDQQRINQKEWRKRCQATEADLKYAYSFIQWCDALSLILCRGHVPPESRRLEISRGPDKVAYFLMQRDDETLLVDPWPFDTAEFGVYVEVAELTQVVFANDTELYQAIQQAPVERKEWVFRKS